MGYFVEPQRDNFQKAVDGYLGRRLSSHCPAFKQGIWGNPYQQLKLDKIPTLLTY